MSVWGYGIWVICRCRIALLGIYWERVEELGRWAVATVQWRLRKVQQLQYQSTWDHSRVRPRSQEEVASYRTVRESNSRE